MNYPTRLKIGENLYPIEYESILKATSSVRVRNGRVILKLSRFVCGKKRDEIVAKFLKWADKRLSKVSQSDFILPVYKNGGRICTHNKVYELQVVKEMRKNANVKLIGNVITLSFPGERFNRVQELAEKIIIKDQTPYLREVIDELNQLYFKERYHLCRFKRTNHRFGSCSSKRNINIAFRLLFAPREIFRYVCLHELAHLKEMNHSKRFWSLVGEAMPEYKDYEKWLRHSGFMLG